MIKKIIIVTITFMMIACQQNETNENEKTSVTWQMIYKHNKKGESLFGSKEELLSEVRNGNPIRVGWSSRRINDTTKSVEHIIDGEFLTIANGKEVFVQIRPFMGQRPDLTSDTLSMALIPSQLHWILGTNGTMSSLSLDYVKDTVTSNPPSTFRYDISWFTTGK